MNGRPLLKRMRVEHHPRHVHVGFTRPHRVLSSAVLNAGLIMADRIINLKVPPHNPLDPIQTAPEKTIAGYCSAAGWRGTVVGMMTAASMDSVRVAVQQTPTVQLAVIVSAGLSNARRAGDAADPPSLQSPPAGTINTIVLTNRCLTDAAMVEAVVIATEAKAAALQDLNIFSPLSHQTATGTGTDAIAVVSGIDSYPLPFAGKHTLFGERLARAVIEALTASLTHQGPCFLSETTL